MSQRIGSWKTNTEHHLIPTGYGNASNKSSPVGRANLTREKQREGLCLASINRQFIQSALWIWDWILFAILKIHSETKRVCYEYRPLFACQWKCLQQEALSKWDAHSTGIVVYFLTKSNTPTWGAEYITVLNCHCTISFIVNFPQNCLQYDLRCLNHHRYKRGSKRDTHRYACNNCEKWVLYLVECEQANWMNPSTLYYLHGFVVHVVITI